MTEDEIIMLLRATLGYKVKITRRDGRPQIGKVAHIKPPYYTVGRRLYYIGFIKSIEIMEDT